MGSGHRVALRPIEGYRGEATIGQGTTLVAAEVYIDAIETRLGGGDSRLGAEKAAEERWHGQFLADGAVLAEGEATLSLPDGRERRVRLRRVEPFRDLLPPACRGSLEGLERWTADPA